MDVEPGEAVAHAGNPRAPQGVTGSGGGSLRRLILENAVHRTGLHLPTAVLRIEAAVREDVPVLFVDLRLVGAEIITGPARLLPEQHGAHVGLSLPHAVHV